MPGVSMKILNQVLPRRLLSGVGMNILNKVSVKTFNEILVNLNLGQDTRTNRTRHTSSSNTRPHVKHQPTNAHLTFTKAHTHLRRRGAVTTIVKKYM